MMSAADKAFAEAERRIAEALRTGAERLSFDDPATRALTRLPDSIAGLTGLMFLDLNNTQVSDLTPLAGMVGMRTLLLDHTQVSDLTPLAGLVGMEILWLDRTQVSDLTPLAGMEGMTTLSLNGTQVSDLTPLVGMVGMSELWLSGIPALDLRPILGMKQLITYGAGNAVYFSYTGAGRVDPVLEGISRRRGTVKKTRALFEHLERSQPPQLPEVDIEQMLRGPILADALVDISKPQEKFEATVLDSEPDRAPDRRYGELVETLRYGAGRLAKVETANRIGRDAAESFKDYAGFAEQRPLNPRVLGYLAEGIRAVVLDPDLSASLDVFDLAKVSGFLHEHDQLIEGYFKRSLMPPPLEVTTDPEILVKELFPKLKAARDILADADARGLFAPSVSDALEMLHRRAEGARKRMLTTGDEAERSAAVAELRRNSLLVTAYLGRIKGRLTQWVAKQVSYAADNPLMVTAGWYTIKPLVEQVIIALTPVFNALWHLIGNLPLPF